MDELSRTDRTTLRRLPNRGVYDRASIHSILDEGLICHVGFVVDGQPYVIPTIHVRVGEQLFFHGSPASRMLRALEQGVEVCVTVTLLDGLVLARSAFHHSMNYRSAVVFGTAMPVESSEEKLRVLRALSDHLIKGRWQEVRTPSPSELKGSLRKLTSTSVNRRRPPSMPRAEPGLHGLKSWGRNLSRKVREARSSSSQKRSERGQEVVAAR